MPTKTCCESVFDITKKRSRKCKLYPYFREYCYVHATKRFKGCILIQKIWRGYFSRKKLKNLFYNLPGDLQLHVMKYVRVDHYIEKKWIPSVLKIYKNRIFNLHNLKKDLSELFSSYNINHEEYRTSLYTIYKNERHNRYMIDLLTGA